MRHIITNEPRGERDERPGRARPRELAPLVVADRDVHDHPRGDLARVAIVVAAEHGRDRIEARRDERAVGDQRAGAVGVRRVGGLRRRHALPAAPRLVRGGIARGLGDDVRVEQDLRARRWHHSAI